MTAPTPQTMEMTMATETTDTFETCRQRVSGAVRGLLPHQINAIAGHHYATGESVWHSLHVVLDTPVCHCVACQRGEAK